MQIYRISVRSKRNPIRAYVCVAHTYVMATMNVCVSIHKRSHKAIHTYVYAITYLCVKTGKFPTRKTKEGRQKPRLGFLPPLSFILYEDN